MKRIQMMLAALAIVVTSLAAFAVPAMADDLDCRDAKGDLIRCDGDLYEPYETGSHYYNDYYTPFYTPYFTDYNYGGYDEDDFEDDFEDYLEDYYNW
jgi:hypothetical protein